MDDDPRKHIGKSCQLSRKRAGFRSARAYAEQSGMNPYTYTNYEQGNRPPTDEILWQFADDFNCSIDDLIGRPWPPEAASADPMRDELVRCYDASTTENRHSLDVAARNATLASGEAAQRDDVQAEGVSA